MRSMFLKVLVFYQLFIKGHLRNGISLSLRWVSCRKVFFPKNFLKLIQEIVVFWGAILRFIFARILQSFNLISLFNLFFPFLPFPWI
jgi:hypothetical protein